MSTDEPGQDAEPLSGGQRRRRVGLPTDPADEELARDWTLTAADLVAARRCRGELHPIWFALELCTVRKYGRFLDSSNSIPLRIINHLATQLTLPPVLFLAAPERAATRHEIAERIRDYLELHPYDPATEARLEPLLQARAREGRLSGELAGSLDARAPGQPCCRSGS